MKLRDKVAIITGAGGGMGSAAVKLFARQGAKVVATGIRIDKVRLVAEEVNAGHPGSVITMRHDVSSAEDWEQVLLGKV